MEAKEMKQSYGLFSNSSDNVSAQAMKNHGLFKQVYKIENTTEIVETESYISYGESFKISHEGQAIGVERNSLNNFGSEIECASDI